MSETPASGPLDVRDGRIWREGRPRLLRSATVQYFRLAPAEWRDRLGKVRACGFDAADVHVPWNHHELSPGRFDFARGGRGLLGFLRLAQAEGLDVLLRPGPYIGADYEGGGLPARLALLPPGTLREAAAPYLAEALGYWRAVLAAIAPLQADRGGPVVMLQVENELDQFPARDPAAMVRVLVAEARAAGITVPLFTCAGERIAASGGEVEGVLGGINAKSPTGGSWEDRYLALGRTLAARGVPLMVIETDRDPAVLRRLVGVGAKLLGPYLVAGGVHLGPTAASNNWAPVPAFLSSDYDLRSPIAADGHLRPGFQALRELFATLDLFPDFFGAALPAAVPADARADGSPGLSLHALEHGDERVLVATNDQDEAVRLRRSWPGGEAEIHLFAKDSQFLFEGVRLPGGERLWSTLEPVGYDPGRGVLTLVGRPAQAGSVAVGGARTEAVAVPAVTAGVALVSSGSLTLEVRARQSPPREELAPNPLRNLPCPGPEATHSMPVVVRAAAIESPPWPEGGGTGRTAEGPAPVPSLEALGEPGTGEVWYPFEATPGARAVAFAAADVAWVYADGRFVGAALPGGRTAAWPLPEGARRLWVRVVSWGHSPFWDERLPALRMGSRRGIVGGAARFLPRPPRGKRVHGPTPVRLCAEGEWAGGTAAALAGRPIVLADHRAPWLQATSEPHVALAQGRGVSLAATVEGVAPGTRVHLALGLTDVMAAVYLDGLLVGRHLAGPALSPHMTGGALPDGEFILPWGLIGAERLHDLEIRLWPLSPGAACTAGPDWRVYPS